MPEYFAISLAIPRANPRLAGVLLLIVLATAVTGCGQSSDGTTGPGSAAQVSAASEERPTATRGTARIEGANPAAVAANVALTVFPSRTRAQHPASVALVGDDNWQNTVAASVLMAQPIRAPVLVGTEYGEKYGEPAEATTRVLEILRPLGTRPKPSEKRGTDGVPVYVFGHASSPATYRSSGTNASYGAAQAAEIEMVRSALAQEAPQGVIIAPEDAPGFAVPASAWAARFGHPVLYSGRDAVPRATRAALRRFRPRLAYVLGPVSAISSSVQGEIDMLARHVKRISGETPAENSVALARYADDFDAGASGPGAAVLIARSNAPLEAALASPLSTSGTPGPLLLTESAERLPPAVRGYLLSLGQIKHVWIVGDEEAISTAQQEEIEQIAEADKD